MSRLVILMLALVCALAVHLPTIRTQAERKGYIVAGEYACMDFMCPEWSFETTRLITNVLFPFEKEEKVFQTLVPTAPVAVMAFPAYTAYDASIRTYYTLLANRKNFNATHQFLFVETIANDLSHSNMTFSVTANAPTLSLVASIQASKGQLFSVHQDGTAVLFNTTTGHSRVVTNVLGSSSASRFITKAVAVDPIANVMYAISLTKGGISNPHLVTFNLNNFKVSSTALGPLRGRPVPPIWFEMVWVPTLSRLIVASTGNWDDLVYINPSNPGARLEFCAEDLSQFGWRFRAQPSTFDDDLWSDMTFDSDTNTVLFQGTQAVTQGVTALLVAGPFKDTPKPLSWIDAVVEPLSFGFIGMQYVSCIGKCQAPGIGKNYRE